MYSVRRRLTLVLAAGFVVLILGTGFYVLRVLNQNLTAEFDAALLTKARAIMALTDQEHGQIEFDYDAGVMPEFESAVDPEYFQFWLDDGTPLMRSTRLDRDLLEDLSLNTVPTIHDSSLPDGRPGRLLHVAYVPRGPRDMLDEKGLEDHEDGATLQPPEGARGLVLAMARDRSGLDRLLAESHFKVLGIGVVAVLIAVLLVWWTLAVGFRPIDAIAAQVAELDADRLEARVQPDRTPAELAPVVEQLNALLARLHASFERERRFTGNVAHELRTPIAELRSLASVGAKWPEDKASVTGFFQDVRDVADRMEGVIGDLLLLARCQAGVEHAAHEPVEVGGLIGECWAALAPSAAARQVRFHLETPPEIVLESDPGKLTIVLANLLGNAVSYSLRDSEIRCVVSVVDSSFRIEVTNDAEPLSEEDLHRLDEPFWRRDAARSSEEHAGLGLSLVAALTGLLGLSFRFGQDREGAFSVRLEGSVLQVERHPARSTRRSEITQSVHSTETDDIQGGTS